MKEFFHICFSSNDEVMFRDASDYLQSLKYINVNLPKTETRLLALALMSNHGHFAILSEKPIDFVNSLRISYSKYFNNKYLRKGKLGEKGCFELKVEGIYHQLTALSYVLRNPVHHKISGTPFGYQHSSAKCYFSRDIGFENINCESFLLQKEMIDYSHVEHLFGTPRAFLYYMNRLSSEEWHNEQLKDNKGGVPISLDLIEQGTNASMTEMLSNEKGKNKPYSISDIDLCTIIDNHFLTRFHRESYTQLTDREKRLIADSLINKYHPTKDQLTRCLLLR